MGWGRVATHSPWFHPCPRWFSLPEKEQIHNTLSTSSTWSRNEQIHCSLEEETTDLNLSTETVSRRLRTNIIIRSYHLTILLDLPPFLSWSKVHSADSPISLLSLWKGAQCEDVTLQIPSWSAFLSLLTMLWWNKTDLTKETEEDGCTSLSRGAGDWQKWRVAKTPRHLGTLIRRDRRACSFAITKRKIKEMLRLRLSRNECQSLQKGADVCRSWDCNGSGVAAELQKVQLEVLRWPRVLMRSWFS